MSAAPHALRRRHLSRLLLLLALTLSAACGGDDREPRAPVDAPAATLSPGEALELLRAAAAGGTAGLRRELAAWPADDEAYREAEETRIALTWRIRVHLQQGRVERALEDHALLRERFEGRGLTPEGRPLRDADVALGIFEDALMEARRRIEGPCPDPSGARAALDVARSLESYGDALDARRLDAVGRWIGLGSLQDLSAALDLALSAHEGPRIVVLTDDFTLGEAVFVEVLSRWQREGEAARLRVGVVPVLRGQLRIGLRRIPAASVEEETAAIRNSAAAGGLALEKALAGEALGSALGLEAQDVAVIVADERQRILARISGASLDPRKLEKVFQRLVSR